MKHLSILRFVPQVLVFFPLVALLLCGSCQKPEALEETVDIDPYLTLAVESPSAGEAKNWRSGVRVIVVGNSNCIFTNFKISLLKGDAPLLMKDYVVKGWDNAKNSYEYGLEVIHDPDNTYRAMAVCHFPALDHEGYRYDWAQDEVLLKVVALNEEGRRAETTVRIRIVD